MQHEMLHSLQGGKHFLAPISQSPQNVLDVGCGTGIWAIDFADMYPSANVMGELSSEKCRHDSRILRYRSVAPLNLPGYPPICNLRSMTPMIRGSSHADSTSYIAAFCNSRSKRRSSSGKHSVHFSLAAGLRSRRPLSQFSVTTALWPEQRGRSGEKKC